MLFAFNSLMKPCHSNKKTQFGNSHVTDNVLTLDVSWEDILWQMLSCCGLAVFWVENCQTYKTFFKNCLKGFWEIFYDNYNLPILLLLLLLL